MGLRKRFILLFVMLFFVASCTSNMVEVDEGELFSSESNQRVLSDSEVMMALHCQEMKMPGCEEYDSIELTIEQIQRGCDMMPGMEICESLHSDEDEVQKEITLINRSISNLDLEKETQIVELNDGDGYTLSAELIKKEIQGNEIRMFGYNGQIPGPLLKVEQNSTINITFINNLDMPTTTHWHGLRLDNRFDGVPGSTQSEILPGESFEYTLYFPDEGIYWYHPHVREDLQQELGLYGNILVDPIQLDYYNQVNQENSLVLDDILIENGDIIDFTYENINHVVMGRFGNINLINGEDNYELNVLKGEVRRFYLTNVANVRTFNFTIPGVKLKLIGSDSGSYEKETYVDSVVISPSERYIVEAYFENSGSYDILNKNPIKTSKMGSILVSNEEVKEDFSGEFLSLRENNYIISQIDPLREYFDKEIDYEITLDIEMGEQMHMEESEIGSMMNSNEDHEGMSLSHEEIEWEDTMPMMSSITNETTKWILQDKETSLENMDINYNFEVGDKIKIRLYNDPNSMHPMQHPIHFHGQRFLVLEKDGVKNDNLAWKDTVLVPIGSTVDILLDVTNPGNWMAHCHIAEHLQAGMMMHFNVEEK